MGKKHPKKEGRWVLDELERLGWWIDDPPKYFTAYCPCGDHMTQIHITPSNPRHWQERLNWAKRQPCMRSEPEEDR